MGHLYRGWTGVIVYRVDRGNCIEDGRGAVIYRVDQEQSTL